MKTLWLLLAGVVLGAAGYWAVHLDADAPSLGEAISASALRATGAP
ncbi:MAG TPA: endopeptidase, partial [Xanthomonadaceae bacterium]|nr:endopeptidase [Xanthomonadaceae bacterium]